MPWRTGIYNDDSPENVRSTIWLVCFLLIIGYGCINVFSPNNDVNLGLDTIIGVLGLYVVFKYLRRSVLTILTGSGDSSAVDADRIAIERMLFRMFIIYPLQKNQSAVPRNRTTRSKWQAKRLSKNSAALLSWKR